MVHIVKKTIGNHTYLSIQKSVHIPSTKKKKTIYVKYLGREDRYTPEKIKQILDEESKKEENKK